MNLFVFLWRMMNDLKCMCYIFVYFCMRFYVLNTITNVKSFPIVDLKILISRTMHGFFTVKIECLFFHLASTFSEYFCIKREIFFSKLFIDIICRTRCRPFSSSFPLTSPVTEYRWRNSIQGIMYTWRGWLR